MAKPKYPTTSIRLMDVADLVERHAKENDVSKSKLIREAVRSYLSTNERADFKTIKEFTTEFHAFRLDLNRVGGLLNQIARKLNIYISVDPERIKLRQQDLMGILRKVSLTIEGVEDAIKDQFK